MAVVGAVAAPPDGASAGQRVAQASSAPASPLATPVPAGHPLNVGMPTPYPVNTLAPLTGGTSLPYPAYGTPVPGVNAGNPLPGVSAILTLQQSEMIGFARSPVLTSARADVGVAAAEVRLERSGLLPSLSGAADYDFSHSQPGSGGLATSASGTTFTTRDTANDADVSLSLKQLIFDGGRTAAGIRAATENETAFADTYRRDLETVAYDVATAYYSYLAAERTTQVDLEIVREDQVQVDLVTAQVRAGTAARSDIATVELPVAQARLAVVRAQGAELAAEATFANAMGLDANVRVQPVDDAPVYTGASVSSIPVPTYDAALKRALALRPDYDSSVQGVNQAKSLLREAQLGLFPTLSGSGSATDQTTNGSLGAFRNSQALGLALSIPIYDQGVTAANVASARASLDKANAILQTTALTVALNIKQALTGLVSASAAVDQTKVEYSTAVTNLQATQAQYRAGVTTLPLLLNAQVQLTQALTDQLTSVYNLRQAEQTYLYQVGANYDASAVKTTVHLPRATAASAHRTSAAVLSRPSAPDGGTGLPR
jgi:outer membrane protein TolC